MPTAPLPFPATVVASEDDPYVTLPRARSFAAAWGATFVDAGPKGHLNADSGLGDWPEGRRHLETLLARASLPGAPLIPGLVEPSVNPRFDPNNSTTRPLPAIGIFVVGGRFWQYAHHDERVA